MAARGRGCPLNQPQAVFLPSQPAYVRRMVS